MHKLNYSFSEMGQAYVEYVLIIGSIALVAVLSLAMTGTSIQELYCTTIIGLNGIGCGCVASFNSPAELNDWQSTSKSSSFTIENGKACISDSREKVLNTCTQDFGDSNFMADIQGVTIEKTGGSIPGYDFIFRAQDEDNHYMFSYNSRRNKVLFWKIANGKWINLGSAKVPPDWADQSLDFQIQVEGDTFKAYKDGVLLLQAADGAYTEGMYGLRNKRDSITCVDQVSIQQYP